MSMHANCSRGETSDRLWRMGFGRMFTRTFDLASGRGWKLLQVFYRAIQFCAREVHAFGNMSDTGGDKMRHQGEGVPSVLLLTVTC